MTPTKGTCTATIRYYRWWLPSLSRMVVKADNLLVVNFPPDAEFIEESGQAICGLPADWNDGPDWRCRWHAEADGSYLPTVLLQDLIEAQER